MKYWVIDTNVVVSGLLNPEGYPARVLQAAEDGRIKLAYDSRILAEYRDVLRRPKLRLKPQRIAAFLAGLDGQMLVTPVATAKGGPDPDDRAFVETALATLDRTIVTGNLADYPDEILNGVRVITPGQAAAELATMI
jgi:putative PIN family toxin of toxin-antitoxin system